MEYDVFKIDRRISQAYKKWYLARGATTVSWRQSLAEWMLQQSGYSASGLPPAPPRQAPGRPAVALTSAPISIKEDGKPMTAEEAQWAEHDKRKAEVMATMPKLNGNKPKHSDEWNVDEMMGNPFTRAQWEEDFSKRKNYSLDQFIKDLNYIYILEN